MSHKAEIDKTSGRGLSRRSFLKMGAAAAGGVVGESLFRDFLVFAGPLPAEYVDKEFDGCCQFCQVRCTTKVQVKDGRVVNVYGNPDNYWTGGAMCPKGKSMVELTYSPHRLLYPLLRQGSDWRRITYQEALNIVAEKVFQVKKEFPEEYAHRVSLFAPLWESRESEIAAETFMHMAGFPDICHPGDGCIGNTATTLSFCLGSGISPTTLDEITNTETAILFGANIAEMYPPYMRWLTKAREKGVKIIYTDPRITPTSAFCDLQLRPRPGTEGAMVLAIIRHLIEKDRIDRDFIQSRVNGFDDMAQAVKPYSFEHAAEITTIPASDIENLAEIFGRSKRVLGWLGGSLSRYTNSIQTVRSIIGLFAITNNLSGTGKGLMNVQGGKPGGGEEFEEHYKAADLEAALNFRKVRTNMERGAIDVLFLNSSFRRYPESERVREAISKVKFVVNRGFFMTEEAKASHLIIPATLTYEGEGSQYGAQRQVVWRERVIEPMGECVEDWKFYADLGKKVVGDKFPTLKDARDIYEQFRHGSTSWAGMPVERVRKSPTGFTWPNTAPDQPEKRGSLYPDNQFLTPDGKVQLKLPGMGPFGWAEPQGSPFDKKSKPGEFPLVFTQGKVVQHWQHTFTSWSDYMAQFSDGNFVQINPETAKGLGFSDGDPAWLETSVGKIKGVLRITDAVRPGIIWTPSHPDPASPFGGNEGASINSIIPSYWDKVAAQFNGFGCRLIKA